jgi:hypothetical protein
MAWEAKPSLPPPKSWQRMTLAEAAEMILKSNPRPIQTREIWEAMQTHGITTTAKQPLNLVDATLHDLIHKKKLPIRKLPQRMYEWIGDRSSTVHTSPTVAVDARTLGTPL